MGGCNPLVLICSVVPTLNSNNQSYLYSLEGNKRTKNADECYEYMDHLAYRSWDNFHGLFCVEMTKSNLLFDF